MATANALQPSESEVDRDIRTFWEEHRRLGPFAYAVALRFEADAIEVPEMWFPETEPPWDEATKREWLVRANEFMRRLKEAWSKGGSTDKAGA